MIINKKNYNSTLNLLYINFKRLTNKKGQAYMDMKNK